MKYLYHYTCVQHWQKIKDTGYLILTESNLKSGLKDDGYRDAVA